MDTRQTFEVFVAERFGGVLCKGVHSPGGQACVLEAWNCYQGHRWSDLPEEAGCYDLRPLNDMDVPNAVRTSWMLKLMQAYAGSLEWPLSRQVAVVAHIACLTVQRLAGTLPGVSYTLRQRCERVQTLTDAVSAAAEVLAEATQAVGAVADTTQLVDVVLAVRAAIDVVRAATVAAETVRAAGDAAASAVRAAAGAAWSAAGAAADAAAGAAHAAAVVASAADAAAGAAAERVFVTTCTCWLEAAQETAPEQQYY